MSVKKNIMSINKISITAVSSFFLLVLFLVITLGATLAQAEDTHNFYFQKSAKPKVIEEEGTLKPIKDPAKVPASGVTKLSKKPKSVDKVYDKKWEASFGVGLLRSDSANGYYMSNVTRKTYVFGARYFFSRFFDVNGEFIYDRGQNEYGGRSRTHGPLLKIGGGTTPIHFTFLGYPFWEWGFNFSGLFGSEKYLGGENMLLMIGHSQSFNFTRSLSLTFNLNYEIAQLANPRAATYGLKLAYRW